MHQVFRDLRALPAVGSRRKLRFLSAIISDFSPEVTVHFASGRRIYSRDDLMTVHMEDRTLTIHPDAPRIAHRLNKRKWGLFLHAVLIEGWPKDKGEITSKPYQRPMF